MNTKNAVTIEIAAFLVGAHINTRLKKIKTAAMALKDNGTNRTHQILTDYKRV